MLVRRHKFKRLLGASGVSALQVAERQARQRLHVLLVFLQNGSENFGGALKIASVQRLLGGCQNAGNVRLRLVAHNPVDERANGLLGWAPMKPSSGRPSRKA